MSVDKFDLSYKDIPLYVEGVYTEGDRGTDIVPPFPSDFVVYSVFVGDVDITVLLSAGDLDEITNLIIEKIEG